MSRRFGSFGSVGLVSFVAAAAAVAAAADSNIDNLSCDCPGESQLAKIAIFIDRDPLEDHSITNHTIAK